MAGSAVSQRIQSIAQAMTPFLRFITEAPWSQRGDEPGVNNFMVGDPHDPPLPEYVSALQRALVPQSNSWFAYQTNKPEAQQVVAGSLRTRLGMEFAPEDICMTTGAFAGLAVSLNAVVDAGDEVIYIKPPWFFYEAMIVAAGGKPVCVQLDMQTFDLDLEAIAAAITERTRVIIVNTPHNPTGKVLSPDTLRRLGALLTQASERNGRTIYVLADESYCRILYDGRTHTSPAIYYPHTLIVYTYGKTLLAPGQRIGYVALPPTLPLAEREQLRMGLLTATVALGHLFPNALLQHAIGDLEQISIDMAALQQRRDRLVTALHSQGYEATLPEGTFYVMVKSPWADDAAFAARLAEHDILTLPGNVVQMPGWFRLSLTASDAMVERAIPRFAAALQAARQKTP
jgi:aspartate aminotransferase